MSNPHPVVTKGPKPKPQTTLPNGLTVREDRFVDEYLLDLNATKAAIRAKYSQKHARSIGSDVLRKPHVQAVIQERIAERAARTKIDTDWVVVQLREQMADALTAGDRGVAYNCTHLLAKHVGGFNDRLELSGAVSFDITTAKASLASKLARLLATRTPTP